MFCDTVRNAGGRCPSSRDPRPACEVFTIVNPLAIALSPITSARALMVDSPRKPGESDATRLLPWSNSQCVRALDEGSTSHFAGTWSAATRRSSRSPRCSSSARRSTSRRCRPASGTWTRLLRSTYYDNDQAYILRSALFVQSFSTCVFSFCFVTSLCRVSLAPGSRSSDCGLRWPPRSHTASKQEGNATFTVSTYVGYRRRLRATCLCPIKQPQAQIFSLLAGQGPHCAWQKEASQPCRAGGRRGQVPGPAEQEVRVPRGRPRPRALLHLPGSPGPLINHGRAE